MNIAEFSIARLPHIHFGAGVFSRTAGICSKFGRRLLIVTGAQSFQQSPYRIELEAELTNQHIDWRYFRIAAEPSPELIDQAVKQFADDDIDLVLGIGGGSALDAAKAIAGLLKPQTPVMDYLEGVGPERRYEGPALPFVAVPTTAGTGSEATKNAVLSQHGESGFKKSFRDDQLVAQYAIVDPLLLSSCPPAVIAANGMDALTQLLESLVSTRANPLTDALAMDGLRHIRDGLISLYQNNAGNLEAQSSMAYASMLSGICLAQTGLGSVHGLASPLGAFFPIPHGVACGRLLAEATQLNIKALLAREPDSPALKKYALASRLLGAKNSHHQTRQSIEDSLTALCDLLIEWTERLQLPNLSHYGITHSDIAKLVKHSRGSSMQTNPVVLSDTEIAGLIQACL